MVCFVGILNKKLTVVIVSYNSFETLVRCMDGWLCDPGCRVIIIDNASKDESAKKLKARYKNIDVVSNATNIGYGRAANCGLQMAQTPYVFLLNPDVIVCQEQLLHLTQRAEQLDDKVAILAPAVTGEDFLQSGLLEKKWVIGAAMLFNMPIMKSVGFFDENIFLFAEETDLCRRVVNAGLPIYLDSDIYLEHLLNQSSTPSVAVEVLKSWHAGWSRMYYRRKHGLNTGKKAEWRVIVSYLLRSLLSFNSLKRQSYRARFDGCLTFVRGEAAFNADGTPRTFER